MRGGQGGSGRDQGGKDREQEAWGGGQGDRRGDQERKDREQEAEVRNREVDVGTREGRTENRRQR